MSIIVNPYLKFITHLRTIVLLCALLLLPCLSHAQTETLNTKDMLMELDLEQLLDVQVISAAKKLQVLSKSASAIFVITADDIRRSSKTTIPELLRMVPGMEVASFNAHTWAISTRGFNSLYANKLLVLLDGRNVYSWEFSGTRWYTVDTLLEDIERIEIIRGPGGTLWGANAVNGVINILTKDSAETQGWLAAAGSGSHEEGFVHLRYGGAFDEYGQNTYRVYVKRHDRDRYSNTSLDDSWRQETVGMRMDGKTPSNYRWRVSADVTRNTLEDGIWNTRQATTINSENYNLLGRISSAENAEQDWHLQMYFQNSEQTNNVLPDKTNAFDIEWQHRFSPYQNHDLVWGLNARRMSNELETANGFSFKETDKLMYLFSGFVQDEFVLSPDRWILTLGAKVEHYENSGTAFLPNVRLLWTPNELNSAWLSVARAVRPASRFEQETRYEMQVGAQQFAVFSANEDFESEYLTAYELGWRQKASPHFNWEAVAFVHDYTDLMEYQSSSYVQDGIFYFDSYPTNQGEAQHYGSELVLTWQPDTRYFMQLAYTWLDSDTNTSMAKHQASLRTGWQIADNFRSDLWLRYVDKVCDFASPVILMGECIEAYNTVDLRLAWQVSKQLELSLSGANLLDSRHLEYESEGSDFIVSEVPRQFYLQVLWEDR